MPSFYIPLSGLDADSTSLNTIANNLSNMSTTGFKAQTTNFSDLFYQQVGTTGSGDEIQEGTGVQVASNSTDFTGGSISSTGVETDAAIDGSGFFVLDAGNGSQLYTRDGNFQVSSTGTLESTQGQAVMGYLATNGVVNTSSGLADLNIPTGQVMQPSATTSFSMTQNLDSAAAVGATATGQVQVYDSLGKSYEATVTYTNLGNNKWSYAITLPDTLTAAAATAPAATTMAVTATEPVSTSVTAATTVSESTDKVSNPVSGATPVTVSASPTVPFQQPVAAATTNPAVAVTVDTTTTPGTTATTYTFAATGTAGVGSNLQFTVPANATTVAAPAAGESLANYAKALQAAVGGVASGITITATGNSITISGATGSYTTSGSMAQDVSESTTNFQLTNNNGTLAQISPSTTLNVQIGNGAVISAPAFTANEDVATYAKNLQAAVGGVASGVTITGSDTTGILSITGPSNVTIGGNLVQNFTGTQYSYAFGSYTDSTTTPPSPVIAKIDPSTTLSITEGAIGPISAPAFTTAQSVSAYATSLQTSLTNAGITDVTVTGTNGVLSITGPATMTVAGNVNQNILGTTIASSITPTTPVSTISTVQLFSATTTPSTSSTTTLSPTATSITATNGTLPPAIAIAAPIYTSAVAANTSTPNTAIYTFAPSATVNSQTALTITDTTTNPTTDYPITLSSTPETITDLASDITTQLGATGISAANVNGTLTISTTGDNFTVKKGSSVQQDVAETTTNYNFVTSNGNLATVDPNTNLQVGGVGAGTISSGESIASYAAQLQSVVGAGVTVTGVNGVLSITAPTGTVTGKVVQDFNATNQVYNFGATGTVSTTTNLKITGLTAEGALATTGLPTIAPGEQVQAYATALNQQLTNAGITGVTVSGNNATGQLTITGPSTIETPGTIAQNLDLTTTNYNFVTSNSTLATVSPDSTLAITEGATTVSVPALTTSATVAAYATDLQAALTKAGITDVTVTGTGGVLSITKPSNAKITGTVQQEFTGAQSSFDFGSYTDPNSGLTALATVAPTTSLTITAPTTNGGTTTITVAPSNPSGESVLQYQSEVQAALKNANITGITVSVSGGTLSITGPDTATIAGNVGQNMLGTTSKYAFQTGSTVDPTTTLKITGETSTGSTAIITAPTVTAGETLDQYAAALNSAISAAGIQNATVTSSNGQLSIVGANLSTTGTLNQGLADTTITYNFGSSATVDTSTALTIVGPTVSGTPATAITVAPTVKAGETVTQYAADLTKALTAAGINTGTNGVSIKVNGGQLSIIGPAATLKTAGSAGEDLTATTISYNFGTSGNSVATVDAKTNLTITGLTATGAAATTTAPTVTAGESLAQYVNDLNTALSTAGIAGVTVTSTAAGQLSITGANLSTSGTVVQDPVGSANSTGTLTFNANGQLVSPTTNISNVSFSGLSDNAAAMNMNWGLYSSTGGAEISQTAATSQTPQTAQSQNGYASGTYQSFTIGSSGTITASYSNGQNQIVGQIGLASMSNLQGLADVGSTEYQTTTASGLATVGVAGSGGLGSLEGASLEASNVNISAEFSDLIIAQRAFEANSKAVTTFDTITQETINMIH
ncbi:MAG: flagellar hook-basal body complex protein [Terracidiphilus sp.]